ncbi:thrombopoietin receptor isoform X2 [Salminus brasiliensis]|uniref:thrombopoietin receptor isoform X2 n=1 Tax=Salminus brasiliensis TaxID=930266 RepID=UPI003B82E2E3
MDLKLTCSTLLSILIVRISCDPHLSEQVMALLADEVNPKCFTKYLVDLTCFWEAPEGKSYEFFYKTEEGESRCNVSEQRSEEGRVLHICIFPAKDVYMFSSTDLRLVDTHTNTTFSSQIFVEEKLLLDPPSHTSLHHTGKVGQLLVRWQITTVISNDLYEYEIRHSSETLSGTVALAKSPKCEHRLISLAPGEMCTVQMRIRPNSFGFRGHWSNWSPSVTAMVPQPADDVELQCHTPDLHQIQCKWNEERYGYGIYSLHYRQPPRGTWEICDRSAASGIQCVLYGEESTIFEVYLTAELQSFNQTFYSDMFRMNNSIKTKAPDGLKEQSDGERHCLSWNSPLPLISQHLIYQIRYQLQGESEWKLFTVPSPKTNTCLDVQVGSQYSIQVKAMPNGSLYSGHWSAWSKCLVVQLPSNTGLLFIACVPFSLLIISVILFFLLSRYVSKVKQFLWPPVPNLNEVLESFLKDINSQHWEPSFSTKLCDEDIPASVVELMSEGDAGRDIARKPSNCIHFPQLGLLSEDNNGEDAMEGLEENREYVTLNTGEALPCLTGNDYVYKAGDGEAPIPVCHYTNLEDTSAAQAE